MGKLQSTLNSLQGQRHYARSFFQNQTRNPLLSEDIDAGGHEDRLTGCPLLTNVQLVRQPRTRCCQWACYRQVRPKIWQKFLKYCVIPNSRPVSRLVKRRKRLWQIWGYLRRFQNLLYRSPKRLPKPPTAGCQAYDYCFPMS